MKTNPTTIKRDLPNRVLKSSANKKFTAKVERFIEKKLNIFFLLTACIFISETAIMLALKFLPPLPNWISAIIDSSTLSIFIFPLIYFTLFIPFRNKISAHKLREDNYSYMIENIGEGIGIVDTNENFIFTNPAAEKIFGVGKGELKGINLASFFTKESFDFVLTQTNKRLAGEASQYEVEIVLKYGNKKNILVTSTPQYQDGEITGSLGIFRDITEIKKNEATSKYERNLLRAIIDNIPDAIYVKDKDCRKILVNSVELKYTGFRSEEDVIGKTDFEVYSKEVAESSYLDDQYVFNTGLAQLNKEEYFIDNLKKEHWMLNSKVPIKNENNEIIGLVGIFRDITELKKAETSIKYERNLLRALIDNLPDAVYVKDILCRKIIANPVEVKYMGFKNEEEVLGKNDFEIYPKNIADSSYADDQYVFKTGKSILGKEDFFVDNFHQKHWMLNSKVPIKNENGEIIGLVGIGRDITERKSEETQLKLLESVIVHATDAVVITEIDQNNPNIQRIIFVNDAYTKMTGYSKEEIIGKTPTILQGPKTEIAELKRVARNIKTHQPCQFEVINYKKNGEEFWSSIAISPVTDKNKNYTHWVAIKRDITENKNIEQELLVAKEKAESGSKSKSEFLANMSHEIRTPLNSVIGFSDLLLKTNLDGIQEQYVSTVYSSANSLLDIINEILDFSKIEAGKLEIENEKVDIFELGYQVTDVISFQAYKKDLELLLNISLDVPRFIWTDAIRIRQVLVNLLGNAAKFTSKGEIELKIVTLEKDVDGKSIFRFSVRDTGIGINPENQQKIFEAFSQEDSTINRKFGGTGLGLAISRKLINLMGSELKLESELQKGSTFYFDLKAKAVDGDPIEWKNLYDFKKILIVDDNENNRHILKDMMALKSINCDEAVNGLEGIKKLESGNKYDFILMDYHMPVMDGITAIEKIRHDLLETKLPIMLLHSSADDVSINSACQELNVQQRLVKPIKIQDLYESISRIGFSNNQQKIKMKETEIKKASHLEHYKVLVVDDNMFNILLIKTILSQILPNAQISEASNGIEAVETYRSVQPDIVFMDIQMPEMNGYEAAQIIRSIEKIDRIPIIALTAGTLKDEREKCLEAGMNDYVAKPFVSSTIVAAIDKWLVSAFEKSYAV